MYLMGQTLCSRHILLDLGAHSVRGVAVCSRDDGVMRELLLRYAEMNVAVVERNHVHRFMSSRSGK